MNPFRRSPPREAGSPSGLTRSTNSVVKKLHRANWPFVFDGSDHEFRELEGEKTYQLMADIWRNQHDIEQSETFRLIAAEVQEKGRYRHKKYEIESKKEVGKLIQTCFLDLLNSMNEQGYLDGHVSKYATGGLAKAYVWRDGTLWHRNGATHRLVAARLVGLDHGFPIQIVGVHADWLQRHNVRSYRDFGNVPALLERLAQTHPTHSDLHD